jgi:hypothetical protein
MRCISGSSFGPADSGETGTLARLRCQPWGEADVVVVDALVGWPERLVLLERHVAPVALPRGRRLDKRPRPT